MASQCTLLTLPPEIRNEIYHCLFTTPTINPRALLSKQGPDDAKDPSVPLPTLYDFGKETIYTHLPIPSQPTNSPLLLTCRQLHSETHLLYLRNTPFHLTGRYSEPYAFSAQLERLQPPKSTSIRHIVLTAKISHLRALNESWCGIPFGCRDLFLNTLTVVPKRPETHGSAYAEVADLSQSHTLAYILAETLKSLRNVRKVVVRNENCFTEVVWRLVYRSLVYRLWRWGGSLCDLGFRELEGEQGFEVLCSCGKQMAGKEQDWRNVMEEVNRLIGDEDRREGIPGEVGL